MMWRQYVLIGIGILVNVAGFIYNIWIMTHSASRANDWQDGFNEGVEQGKMAEASKHRQWAGENNERSNENAE